MSTKETQNNPLIESGLPLFFPCVKNSGANLGAPPARKGLAVRVAVRSLSLMQKEALVTNSNTGVTWRLASDEGAYLAGQDEAPCPLSFLTTGMVCSYMNETLALAEQRGIEITAIKLIQDNYYTMKGSALKGTMTGGAKDIELEAIISSPASDEDLRALVYDAVAASPLNGLMHKSIESRFDLSHNGSPIDNDRALPIEGDRLTDPDTLFDNLAPEPGDWSQLIVRGGLSPKTEETVTMAGDSLTDHQDRTLHVRGICTLRPDGMKQVEQHIINPHGSIFTYLCEEGTDNGGKGRAPDAASYIAAGIAFCFMTQFGRYAKITKTKIERYAIVQDAHFSLGGATGKTGKPGEADPLETHVFIQSNQDNEFARKALDMSEQTCFLHAFCKAELKAKLKLTRTA